MVGAFFYGLAMEVVAGPDGVPRCAWGVSTEDYLPYHDVEWGYPVADDRTLFEKLCLESFQSGLAWITVLRKRDSFRRAFHNFEPRAVAAMTSDDVERLLVDPSIIRNRAKIESAINNGRRTVTLQESQSLAAFVWEYEPSTPERLASRSPESEALSKALKQLGFTWLGPTTVHAFMQAMGLINDHLDGCAFKEKADAARVKFQRPSQA